MTQPWVQEITASSENWVDKNRGQIKDKMLSLEISKQSRRMEYE